MRLAVTLLNGSFPIGEIGREATHDSSIAAVTVAIHRLDLELPIVGLLRRPSSHDHRADIVGALNVAHVVTLDPQWGIGQPEVLLQLVEGAGSTVVITTSFEAVTSETLLGVLGNGFVQLALVASLRNSDGDLALSEL